MKNKIILLLLFALTLLSLQTETRMLTVTAVDTEEPKYFDNSTNSTVAGSAVEHRLRWTDNSGLSGFIFSFDNCTGTMVNDTWTTFPGSSTEEWSNVTKIINSTVGCTIRWKVYANDTSNNWNASVNFIYVTTTAVVVEVILSQALSDGIMFDDVEAGSTGNPARNDTTGANGGTDYNLTVGSASNVNIDFYNKVTGIEAGMFVNESSSITSESTGFSTNTSVTGTWTVLGDSSVNCTDVAVGNNCWIRFYLDVNSSVLSGYKEWNWTYCAVETGQDPSLCG
jgi:hypothetical protein